MPRRFSYSVTNHDKGVLFHKSRSSRRADDGCRENSDVLRHEFSKKSLQHTLDVRARQVEDCTRRRIAALREDAAWAESEAFEGFKSEMAGVAEARKRADDKHEVERTLDAQMRDNMRRRKKEADRDAAELEAVRRVQAQRDEALAKREADAAAAERALADEIRCYNECASTHVLACHRLLGESLAGTALSCRLFCVVCASSWLIGG